MIYGALLFRVVIEHPRRQRISSNCCCHWMLQATLSVLPPPDQWDERVLEHFSCIGEDHYRALLHDSSLQIKGFLSECIKFGLQHPSYQKMTSVSDGDRSSHGMILACLMSPEEPCDSAVWLKAYSFHDWDLYLTFSSLNSPAMHFWVLYSSVLHLPWSNVDVIQGPVSIGLHLASKSLGRHGKPELQPQHGGSLISTR